MEELKVFGDLKLVSIIFLGSLVFFHALILVTSNRFWKATDYIWLLSILFTILAVTTQVGREIMLLNLPSIQEQCLVSVRSVDESAKKYAESLNNDKSGDELYWAMGIQTQTSKMRSDVEKYLSRPFPVRASGVYHFVDEPHWTHLFSSLYIASHVSDSRLENPLRSEIESDFEDFLYSKQKLFDFEREFVNKNGFILISLFAPWFLSVSLALRFAKVTNENFGDRIRRLYLAAGGSESISSDN